MFDYADFLYVMQVFDVVVEQNIQEKETKGLNKEINEKSHF